MKRDDPLPGFLRSLAGALEKATDQESNELWQRLHDAVAAPQRSPSKVKASGGATKRAAIRAAAQRLITALGSTSTREEASRLVEQSQPTRPVLAEAAKLCDIHVQRFDTNSVIISKLIENLVGASLDSRAIRGD